MFLKSSHVFQRLPSEYHKYPEVSDGFRRLPKVTKNIQMCSKRPAPRIGTDLTKLFLLCCLRRRMAKTGPMNEPWPPCKTPRLTRPTPIKLQVFLFGASAPDTCIAFHKLKRLTTSKGSRRLLTTPEDFADQLLCIAVRTVRSSLTNLLALAPQAPKRVEST